MGGGRRKRRRKEDGGNVDKPRSICSSSSFSFFSRSHSTNSDAAVHAPHPVPAPLRLVGPRLRGLEVRVAPVPLGQHLREQRLLLDVAARGLALGVLVPALDGVRDDNGERGRGRRSGGGRRGGAGGGGGGIGGIRTGGGGGGICRDGSVSVCRSQSRRRAVGRRLLLRGRLLPGASRHGCC